MGALGVLMSIGIFQMDGGASVNSSYEITSPIFDKIEIQLNPKYYSGKKFVITTKNNFPDNNYIQSAKLNGENWTKFSFPHETFSKGGKLIINLGKEPNKNWGNQ
jgi:putative alpha-1,2-mannosidase